jgi:hypothetical protein
MKPKAETIERLRGAMSDETRERLQKAADAVAAAKERGGKVVAVIGSGPNLHEGVTTLVAELMRVGIVDGVTTSSAVVAHEMAGCLERVHRVNGAQVGVDAAILPKDGLFEVSLLPADQLEMIAAEMPLDRDLMERALAAEGRTIIKAAGNLAYPLGLRTEMLAREAEAIARAEDATVEAVVGRGADPMTMLGAGARRGVPVIVSVPQLIGGGVVGMAIGDGITITRRCELVADLLAGADVIIESALALTQEIHDGPFETHTGHGIWAAWQGARTFSLEGKTLIRIDLDPNLDRAWQQERSSAAVADAIARGLPKTKVTGVPFRMEMSGFCRLEGSLPIVADIGAVWPVLAWEVSRALGVELEFLSCRQDLPEGAAMREWIVEQVRPADRQAMRPAPSRSA